jgi:hypothetical protein
VTFNLKIATAVFAETLEGFKKTTDHKPES